MAWADREASHAAQSGAGELSLVEDSTLGSRQKHRSRQSVTRVLANAQVYFAVKVVAWLLTQVSNLLFQVASGCFPLTHSVFAYKHAQLLG